MRTAGIDDGDVFLKCGKLREQFAVAVEREGVAVEDELVVPADGVAVKNRRAMLARDGGEHLEPLARLAEMEG